MARTNVARITPSAPAFMPESRPPGKLPARDGKMDAMRSALLLLLATTAAAAEPTWSTVDAPSAGKSTPIGTYNDGCIRGAVALPLDGPGHVVMRRQRHRYYGHPTLAAFLNAFSDAVHAAGLAPRFIGDAGQPRGGPMPTGHASHQIGLDMDIFFGEPKKVRSLDDLEESDFPNLVNEEAEKIEAANWRPEYVSLLKMAASDPHVERIFVNYVIKRQLCETVTGDRAWMSKVRPWWNHTHHFHVRLHCPPGAGACRAQAPLGVGDGCGDVAWFTRAAVEARRKAGEPLKTPPHKSRMPDECKVVLTASAAPPAPPPRARPGAPAAPPGSTARSAPAAPPAAAPPAPAPPAHGG
jgi:penicillin-insensitive murein endopeptidase